MQEFGLELLERQDNLQRAEERTRRDRYALIASGQYEVAKVFPEWFNEQARSTQPEPAEEEPGVGEFDPAAEDVAYDFSGVQYTPPSEEEREALMREIERESYVEVGGDEGRW